MTKSPCKAFFNWGNQSAESKNISVLKPRCNFESTEKDLRDAYDMMQTVGANQSFGRCLDNAFQFVCHLVYRNCRQSEKRPTTEQCLHVQNHRNCSEWWDSPSLFERFSCLQFPDCQADFAPGHGPGAVTNRQSTSFSSNISHEVFYRQD